MTVSRMTLRCALSLVLAAGLAGCGKGTSDLEGWVAEIKAQKPAPIEPIPQIKQYEAFAYNNAGRRDPFVATPPKSDGTGPRPDLSRSKEPLEEFPLDALRMVGTIQSKGVLFALVKSPDNVVHRVTVKHHLGQNYGEIVKIEDSGISLLELVPDGFGGWVQRPATLALTEQQQKK